MNPLVMKKVLLGGAALGGGFLAWRHFHKPVTRSDFQTMTTVGPTGTPVKVATPVSSGVTVAQATQTPHGVPTVGRPTPVPTTIPGQGVVYAPPNTVAPAAAGGGVFQMAPMVITPTGAASVAVAGVADIQRGLNTLGMCKPALVEDGKLGPLSIACIKAFQAKNGLAVDGNAGPATKAAMSAALSALASSGGSPGATAVQNSPPAQVASGVATTPTGATVDTSPSLSWTPTMVQHALNVLGASPALTEDGKIGPKSVAAIKSFQASHSLVPDGIAGPKTKAALYLATQASNVTMPPPGA